MPGETLAFEILARDNASRAFRSVGDEAAKTGVKVDYAAASMKLFNDTTQKQGKAAATTQAALAQHTKATALLADAENVLGGRATKTTKLLSDQGHKIEELAPKTSRWRQLVDNAATSVGKMGASSGQAAGPSGMGALIAAGVALAPQLVTLGFGLGGLGIAAAGVIKPIQAAAGKAGGLTANLGKLDFEQRAAAEGLLGLGRQYASFQQALEPQVLGTFTGALRLAGHLLGDIQPIAKSTGNALQGVIGQIDANFQSGEWKSFFAWMAQQAGPDVRQLGNLFVALANDLPPLLRDLQPLGSDILIIATDAAKAIRPLEDLATATENVDRKEIHAAKTLDQSTVHWTNFIPGAKRVNDWLTHVQQSFSGTSGAATVNSGKIGLAREAMAQQARQAQITSAKNWDVANSIKAITTAASNGLTPLLTYTGALVTQKNDAASLATALKASGDRVGLNTAAQRASFSAANTYIQDLINTASAAQKTHQGIGAQISSIQAALPLLQRVKGGTQAYWQEVQQLVNWLHRLQQQKAISERIKVTGTGSWAQTSGVLPGQPGKHFVGRAAAGMLVSGGIPGVDSVPLLAQQGEAVVPKHLTPFVAPFLRANNVPGFAAGGLVGSYSGTPGGLVPWGQHNLAVANQQVFTGLAAAMARAFASAVASSFAGAGGPVGGGAAANMAIGRRLAGPYGWASGVQWADLVALWNRESGWNRLARNPTSGAYGIPQALPPGKMGAAANPPTSSASAQIGWGLGYIKGRYGSPFAAWNHEVAYGWYDRGGWLPPGLSLAYNATGRPEQVIPSGRSGGQRVVLEIRSSGQTAYDNFLATELRRIVRVQGGGDVQVALGGG